MKNWTPSIKIYVVLTKDKVTGYPVGRHIFLSYKRAHKFMMNNMEEVNVQGLDIWISSERLWLW